MIPESQLMESYEQLLHAAETKNEEALTRLIREHPDLHDFEGKKGPLFDIIFWKCRELFAAAFQAGLSPDSGPTNSPQTLLQCAVSEDEHELIRLCLAHGAKLERRNADGETALGYAASWGSLDTVRMLVEAGAQVNAIEGFQADQYSTALDATCSDDPAYDRPAIRAYLRSVGGKSYLELQDSSNLPKEPL